MEHKRKPRYKHSEGKRWIEVRIKTAQQLFDSRDPAPFRERDLDDHFVEYVVSSSREFSLSTPLKIVIHIEEQEKVSLPKDSICEAIRSFFMYQIDLQKSDLRNFLKRSQIFLFIGLLTLGLCLSLAENISLPSPTGFLGIIKEGLVIFGWVSIWKPIELILFDWYPLYEKLRFYKKLLGTEIDIHFGPTN